MNTIIKRPAMCSAKEMMMDIANRPGHTTVKLAGVRRPMSFGDSIAQVEIESLEIGGACDDVIKTLELFTPQSPVLTTELAYEPATLPDMPAIGSVYDGDIVGAYIVDEGEIYALLIADKNAEREYAWSSEYEDTEATSYADGAANTKHLFGLNECYPAASYCVAYNGGGYHLPSRLELSLIAANSEAVEAADLEGWYWSSTQNSASSAWHQRFSYGTQNYYSKANTYRVRPVRRLKLII